MNGPMMRIAAALAAVLAFALPAAANDKVVFGTNWSAQAEHGGFYYAKAYGIYDAYGLDVEIVPGGAQVDTTALLIGGKYDFALLSNSFIFMNMVREDIPFEAVAAVFQKDPQVLMAHPEAGLKSLADIKDHPVFISTDARDTYWKFLQIKYGFTDEQVRPYTYSIAPFLADTSVIQQGYVTNEPFRAREAGVDPSVFLIADSGYPSYAALIGTSKKLAADNPDLVRRFVEASLKGWQGYLSGERAKADALILADNADYSQKAADEAVAAMQQYQLAAGGDAAELGLGAMTEARWQAFFDDMVKAGVYPADLDWKKAFSLDFVNKKVAMP